jgi:CRP-like cAMP-binding protein
MAAMLGITIETASRIMTDFKRRGLVKEISGTHCQCDFDQLRRIAQE